MRNITIVSTDAQMKTVESSASTLGELENELNVDWGNRRVVVKETRNTLEHPDSKLPDTDFHLYVTPTKGDGGSDKAQALRLIREVQSKLKKTEEYIENSDGKSEKELKEDMNRAISDIQDRINQ